MSYQLPPLDDPVQFEKLVRDILRRVYDDPGIELYGRSGQSQSGVDGFSPTKSGVTFQSKLKDIRYRSDDSIRKELLGEMEAELAATDSLQNPPVRFIFATTFKNDTHLQEKARSLSTDHLTVEYLGWNTITERIWEYADHLIPDYYPHIPIRPVPGFRRITEASIKSFRIENQDELNKLAIEYYRINDRDEVVSRVVCNDIDVRNDGVMNYAFRRLDALPESATLWILGNGGSGKTTLLHRLALELSQQGRDVYMLNLEYHLRTDDIRSLLLWIKHSSTTGHPVLCVDNPAADEEMLQILLREVPDYCEKLHILLAERGHRYQTLKKTDVLTYLHGEEESEPVIVRNLRDHRQKVYEKLFDLLKIAEDDRTTLRSIALNERLVYVNATYSILLELKRNRKIDFDFDWDDYRKSTSDLPAFVEGYKYIALLYLFGVKAPFSVLSKIYDANKPEQQRFRERFRGLVNEPVILDERRDEIFRKNIFVRTKHEIVSEIFFEEHPELNKNHLLMEWCERTDFNDPIETQALVNIFGARKNLFSEHSDFDFLKLIDFLVTAHLRGKGALSSKLEGTLNLAKFWLLIFQNKVEDAIGSMEIFLENSPENLHCRTELARIYQRRGNLGEAESALLKVLEVKPDDIDSRTELAKVYQRQSRRGEAENVLLTILAQKPNDLNSRLELSKIYQKQNDLGKAENILVELLAISNNNIWANTELSKIYQRQGDLDKAEFVLLDVLKVRPRDLNSRTELAKIYQRQNKLDKAEALLLEIIGLDKNNLQARTELAKIYQRQNKLHNAEALLLEIIGLDKNNLQARTELARIYQRQGKLSEAEILLLKILQLNSDNLLARNELSKIYQRQGKLFEAEVLLLKILELSPHDLQSRTELAKIYQRQNKLDKAEALLLESLEIDDKQLHPRTELAKIYQRQNKLDKAEALLLESLQIDDKQLHPRTELAKIYQRQGKWDEAAQRAEEALRIDSKNDHAMAELLAIWNGQNKKEEGVPRFREFIEQPNYRFTRYSQAPVFRFFQFCRAFGLKEDAKKIFEHFRTELDDQNISYYDGNFR